MSKRQIFNIIYRYVMPALILLAFSFTPGFTFSLTRHSIFDWIMCFFIAGNSTIVTRLDQVPSKRIPIWKRGVWGRLGSFRGDQFNSFYDRSSMKYFYFFMAFANPTLLSIFIALALPTMGITQMGLRILLAIIYFLLILSPFVVFYPAFMKAIYSTNDDV